MRHDPRRTSAIYQIISARFRVSVCVLDIRNERVVVLSKLHIHSLVHSALEVEYRLTINDRGVLLGQANIL